MVERYLEGTVRQDLQSKMVFAKGPGQVGTTTLAKRLIADPAAYLIWDIPSHRERILSRELPPGEAVALDEIHKYRSWRAYLEGLYEEAGPQLKILVPGSARLRAYRRGGRLAAGSLPPPPAPPPIGGRARFGELPRGPPPAGPVPGALPFRL